MILIYISKATTSTLSQILITHRKINSALYVDVVDYEVLIYYRCFNSRIVNSLTIIEGDIGKLFSPGPVHFVCEPLKTSKNEKQEH